MGKKHARNYWAKSNGGNYCSSCKKVVSAKDWQSHLDSDLHIARIPGGGICKVCLYTS